MLKNIFHDSNYNFDKMRKNFTQFIKILESMKKAFNVQNKFKHFLHAKFTTTKFKRELIVVNKRLLS